jgi:hypothetical protein
MRWWNEAPKQTSEPRAEVEPEFVTMAKDLLADEGDTRLAEFTPTAESRAEKSPRFSQLEPTGSDIAASLAIIVILVTLAFAVPLGLASLLSHYLSSHFPQNPDAFYVYYDDLEYTKGADSYLPWFFLLFGYAVGLARRVVIPALVGIVGFIFLRDHADIVQAIVAYSTTTK